MSPPDKPHVGVRDIHMVLVRSGAPHDPSQRTTFADPRLPQDFALLVRIQRMDDAGFLPDTNTRCPLRKLTRIGDWPKSWSGPWSPDSWSLSAPKQEDDEAVICGGLPMPEHPAGRKVKRKNCIAGFRGRIGIVVPGRDIERPTLDIDGRRGPHRRAGRTIELGPDGIPLCRTRRLGDRVGLPDLPAGRDIQRYDAAAKGAALVGGLEIRSTSSNDETGTYRTPEYRVGAPMIRAAG